MAEIYCVSTNLWWISLGFKATAGTYHMLRAAPCTISPSKLKRTHCNWYWWANWPTQIGPDGPWGLPSLKLQVKFHTKWLSVMSIFVGKKHLMEYSPNTAVLNHSHGFMLHTMERTTAWGNFGQLQGGGVVGRSISMMGCLEVGR